MVIFVAFRYDSLIVVISSHSSLVSFCCSEIGGEMAATPDKLNFTGDLRVGFPNWANYQEVQPRPYSRNKSLYAFKKKWVLFWALT